VRAVRPAVSVIVPFAGSAAELDACLAALAALRTREGDEVLVADNRRDSAPRSGPVEVVPAPGPASSYFARAHAAARARADWLVFLDADTLPEPDLLDALFDPPPGERTAVLAGAIEDWAARPTVVARYVTARRKLHHATTLEHPWAPYAQTACCAVRRSAFEAVGGFPDPVHSGGDADLCWRLAAADWRLEPRPAARVRHRNRERARDLLAQLHRHGAGMEWLERRWPGSFPRPRPRELAGRTAMLARGLAREPAFALLDFAALWARDIGRLHANGDPTPPAAALPPAPMRTVNAVIRPLRELRRALRFRVWIAHLRLDLRRRGGRLVLDAPHGARFDSPPHVEAIPAGDGDGTFTLRLGRGVTLGRHMTLEVHARGTNVLELGDGVYFQHGARVQLRSGTIRLGPRTNVRDWTLLRSSGELLVGEEVAISNGTVLHCTRRLELGDLVGLAERVSILDSDHQADGTDAHFYQRPLKVEPVTLGRNVFVAANAVVLCGAHVEPNSVVGANAVVGAGRYPGGWLIAGVPARAVKRLGAPEAG